jgi:hypothetical protein
VLYKKHFIYCIYYVYKKYIKNNFFEKAFFKKSQKMESAKTTISWRTRQKFWFGVFVLPVENITFSVFLIEGVDNFENFLSHVLLKFGGLINILQDTCLPRPYYYI